MFAMGRFRPQASMLKAGVGPQDGKRSPRSSAKGGLRTKIAEPPLSDHTDPMFDLVLSFLMVVIADRSVPTQYLLLNGGSYSTSERLAFWKGYGRVKMPRTLFLLGFIACFASRPITHVEVPALVVMGGIFLLLWLAAAFWDVRRAKRLAIQ